jgi:hypothetical protein
MRQKLQEGHYLIPLVTFLPDRSGKLVPIASKPSTSHWIVLTGFSYPWDGSGGDSIINWVRINNPFFNREEYYLWKDFRRSMEAAPGGYGLLEAWK